ncbi:MAG: adenylate kinase related protein [Amphiamblys sp. WSBS2006]|nr:MAG: adenylate kinase related protein [Amphiamblys sp. WSBS2006]
MKKIFWVLGAPGSGKGTLRELVKKKHKTGYVCAGDLLRSSKDPEILSMVERGLLIPGKKVSDLVIDAKNAQKEDIVLFDGFPRTPEHYNTLTKTETDPVVFIVWLHCEDAVCVERIIKREMAGDKRTDISEEAMQTRLECFRKETMSLFELARADSIPCHEINTTKKMPEEVLQAFEEIYTGYGF